MTDKEGHRSTVRRPPSRLTEEREDALSLRRSFAMKNKVNRKRSRVHRKRSAGSLEEQGITRKGHPSRSTVLRDETKSKLKSEKML